MIENEEIAVDRTRSPTERDSCLTLLQSDAETNDGRSQMDFLLLSDRAQEWNFLDYWKKFKRWVPNKTLDNSSSKRSCTVW